MKIFASLVVVLILGAAPAGIKQKPATLTDDRAVANAAAQLELDQQAAGLWSSLEDTADALDDAITAADRSKKFRLSSARREKLTTLGDRLRSASKKESLSRDEVETLMEDIEALQAEIRNKRQMASTAFQNVDQKANQAYNLLSSIMKAMNETRMGTVRNML